MEPDFSGYATKAGLKCSDGRVITKKAFQHMDGMTVPLVWQHGHNVPENVLGHAKLEVVEDGVRAHGMFNATPAGQHIKTAVVHGDLKSLSIYANNLKETNKIVSHGNIREVSVVLSGANPEAKIDYVRLQHSDDPDDYTLLDEEAIIHSGEKFVDLVFYVADDEDDAAHSDENMTESDKIEHADDRTIKDIYNSMNAEQKDILHYLVGEALEDGNTSTKATSSAEHSDDNKDEDALAHQEGSEVSRNLFENNKNTEGAGDGELKHSLTPDAVRNIVKQAQTTGSLRHAMQQYAETHLQHGVENLDVLFPDAKAVTGTIELEKRRTEWVSDVLANTRKSPFARIKTYIADLTLDDARAKGYVKGDFKKEEWFGVTKRTTDPTTIYKKQKLDRDDIIDITDFDFVPFLKAEMRLMTEEEFARAILIGDGRSTEHEDKVKDPMGASSGPGIRSILNDHEIFVTTLYVNVGDANSSYEEVVDAVMDGMEFYKGTGTPTFYTTIREVNQFKKAKDGQQRRYYENNAQVAEALGVKKVVTVEPMQTQHPDVIGIIVNLDDYNVGTDRGGELTMFDDFDIDYNQYKYLMETRASGALVRPKAALVIRKTTSSNVLVAPEKPSFNETTGVITIPSQTGTVYKQGPLPGDATISAGAMTALTAGQTKTIYAHPASGYYFANTVQDSWPFKRPPA